MKYVYFVVEGPHDAAAIGRILKMHKIKQVRKMENLDEYWHRIIPNRFPHMGDLVTRVPVPSFYQSEEYSVAIYAAGGESKICTAINLTLTNLDVSKLHSVAVFCDADKENPQEKFDKMLEQFQDIHEECILKQLSSIKLGEVSTGTPKVGVYVFPNNEDMGTLEKVLLEGAESSYPDLVKAASSYIENISEEYTGKWKPADNQKVLVGCIANILKPGKANQVSIQDNEWIYDESVKYGSQFILNDFIKHTLDIQ
ncbi:hypothetical protein AVT_11165 [Bacillus tropicus]|nr:MULTISPECIES: DUF3226 domain-containing protein [Bacillus cereus group]MDA1782483.1 hypothetical protein [Bacillus cereus]MDZ4536067.1 hypothetical protein [Bacillus cereus]PDZ41604.1 hypothetical protein CON18_03285 [Bacillus cereus]PEQ58757.1 hypothetical protein CN469_21745 [Bacillus cereus]PET36876.1 hypothetical protein CN520_28690 [Bacillus cereus]